MSTNIETHGVKYLGSKKKLLPYIGQAVADLGAKTAIDVFSGTTRVAQHLRQMGVRTDTSDLSWATTAYANTFVHNPNAARKDLPLWVSVMNESVVRQPGWLSENYTGDVPQDAPRGDGRCFQLKNAMRADWARDCAEDFKDQPWLYYSLITSIIRALDAVDNTVGVQQAYLKEWCKRSYNDIEFKVPPIVEGPVGIHHEGNCLDIDYREADVAYLDPPYSPHSYSTYYHIWDSIARWDKPRTALKARRRADRVTKDTDFDGSMSSLWNSPKTALGAFETLVARLPTRHCLISYSDESIVERDVLLDVLSKYGRVTVSEVDYRRNIMSQIGNAAKHANPLAGQQNKELLILLSR
jgi:adenine-specific DNA-methyltransferase